MKLKLPALIIALITAAIAPAYAQIKITGSITGLSAKPLNGVAISLLKAEDSTTVKITATNADGSYSIEGVKAGNYKISAALMGYSTYKTGPIALSANMVIPTIVLQQKQKELKEVSITSSKPVVEHQVDRTVINVDALISAAGATAMDVLEKSPGVLVDQGGAISLNGKSGVKIFIDDKPTYLSGADLESYLRSLPSSAIDQVELMTNPPAKYDAAGNAGVINIKTKRSKVRGFNGSLNMGYTQGRYGSSNNSLNFNYRNNKLNLFGNLSYNNNNTVNDLVINREFLTPSGAISSMFLQSDLIKRNAQGYNAKIGMDYYVSDKTTFGMVLSGLINPSGKPILNSSTFFNAQGKADSTILADNVNDARFTNYGVNLNYRHQYKTKGHELTFDVDYLDYKTNTTQSYNNTSYLPNGSITNNYLLTGNLPAQLYIYSAKTDYSQPLNNGLKLDAGLKTSYTTTDNIANYFYNQTGVTLPDYGKTNHFLYRENINAAYLNAGKEFKRFSYQMGLRLENTIANGHQLGNVQKPDSTFKQNYTGLFPTFYAQYKLDSAGTQQVSFNYGRRIDRPYYADLNPFSSPLDKFTYYTGNPFLKPSYVNSFALSYSFINVNIEASYSKSVDNVNETIEIVNGIYYSRPGNIGSVAYKTLTVDAGSDPTKWLNLHFFGFVQNIHSVSDFYTGQLNTQGTFFFLRPSVQVKPGKDWNILADASYQSKVTNAQFIAHQRFRVNLSASKKLSASTTVRCAINDIFDTYVNAGDINNLANTLADFRNKPNSRTATLSLSYRFGKAIADQRKHNANGAESEQNRVKN